MIVAGSVAFLIWRGKEEERKEFGMRFPGVKKNCEWALDEALV